MACKRKRMMAARPSSTSTSVPMKTLLFFAAHIIIHDAPSPCSVMAFSPPSRHDTFRPSHREFYANRMTTLSQPQHSARRSIVSSSRLSVLPRSSSDATQTDNKEPFFAQNLDVQQRVENYNTDEDFANEEAQMDYSSMNGNNGGMDAYAQQMQEFTSSQAQEIMTEPTQQAQDNRVVQPPPFPPPPPSMQTESTTSTTAAAAGDEASNNQPISNVDARVLEAILQEGKLDLSSEEEVKNLLDGPRLQEGEELPTEDGDGKYNSKFVSVSIAICVFNLLFIHFGFIHISSKYLKLSQP